jgi:hypothetical protein
MFRDLLRTALIVVLGIIVLVLALRFVRLAFAMALIAVPILIGAAVIRSLWRRGRPKQAVEEDAIDDEFARRYRRLAELEKRAARLDL